jgi:hypothetical protein
MRRRRAHAHESPDPLPPTSILPLKGGGGCVRGPFPAKREESTQAVPSPREGEGEDGGDFLGNDGGELTHGKSGSAKIFPGTARESCHCERSEAISHCCTEIAAHPTSARNDARNRVGAESIAVLGIFWGLGK